MQMARRRGCVTGTLGAGGVVGWLWVGGGGGGGGGGEEVLLRSSTYTAAHRQD